MMRIFWGVEMRQSFNEYKGNVECSSAALMRGRE